MNRFITLFSILFIGLSLTACGATYQVKTRNGNTYKAQDEPVAGGEYLVFEGEDGAEVRIRNEEVEAVIKK
ncbi:MAG: YgdI/YgdR family lipoprotein [Magnetococcales bacterium]|nr:YgdI/YgdR family lipoprotein [Magnetococcales bacterium]